SSYAAIQWHLCYYAVVANSAGPADCMETTREISQGLPWRLMHSICWTVPTRDMRNTLRGWLRNYRGNRSNLHRKLNVWPQSARGWQTGQRSGQRGARTIDSVTRHTC